MVLFLFLGELIDGKFLIGPSDCAALYPFRSRMNFLPIGKDLDDEFYDACIFTDVGRRGMLKRNLHDDANYVFHLFNLYLIKRTSLKNVDIVNKALFYDVETFFYGLYCGWRVKFLHYPACILDDIEEFIEEIHSGLILIAKIEVKQSKLDELIDQKYLQMRLLFLFLQNLNYLGIGIIIVGKDTMMLKILQTFTIESLIDD